MKAGRGLCGAGLTLVSMGAEKMKFELATPIAARAPAASCLDQGVGNACFKFVTTLRQPWDAGRVATGAACLGKSQRNRIMAICTFMQ